jgi:hypothetical protein
MDQIKGEVADQTSPAASTWAGVYGADATRTTAQEFIKDAMNAPAAPAEEAKPAKDPFANNKLFTTDKVKAAQERMKSKLGRLNSGLDPEMLADGITIAGAHIESGVRKFADFARAMIEDMGEAIKPFLKSFYNGVRDYPGLDTEGMDPHDVVSKTDVNAIKAGKENPAPGAELPAAKDGGTLADTFHKAISRCPVRTKPQSGIDAQLMHRAQGSAGALGAQLQVEQLPRADRHGVLAQLPGLPRCAR